MTKAPETAAARPHRNFYGRRKGKHLRDSQEVYLEQDLPA
jgi:tRNA (guanine-N7-)-methyltransferase